MDQTKKANCDRDHFEIHVDQVKPESGKCKGGNITTTENHHSSETFSPLEIVAAPNPHPLNCDSFCSSSQICETDKHIAQSFGMQKAHTNTTTSIFSKRFPRSKQFSSHRDLPVFFVKPASTECEISHSRENNY